MKHLFIAAVFLLNLPAAVFAHGVDISDMTGRQDVHTIRFSYTDGTPMLFAKVKVFPPSSPDAPAQESIADRNGYFSFVNDEPGEWRLTAEDGMGHKGEISVSVGHAETAAGELVPETPKDANAPPLPLTAVLGISLILNVFGAWYVTGIRGRVRKEAGHAH
jgi:uncharacterized GH25 family protein